MDAEKLLEDVTGRLREALDQVESQAKRIVVEAEEEARRIRETAEHEAEERLAKVREALASVEGAIGSNSAGPSSEVEPPVAPPATPAPVRVPEPSPPPIPEPTPPAEPEPSPPDPEIEPPAPAQPDREAPAGTNGSSQGRSNDKTAARIVATKMALDGASRDEIATRLDNEYELADPEKLLDDVLARAKR